MDNYRLFKQEVHYIRRELSPDRECSDNQEAFGIIEELGSDSYALPSYAKSIMISHLFDLLESVFSKIRKLNNIYAGYSVYEAIVMLNNYSIIQEIQDALRVWAEAYCFDRLLKKNTKDKDGPVWKFLRIGDELVLHLQDIMNNTNSINVFVLYELTRYIPWILYTYTWKRFVEYEHEGFKITPVIRGLSEEEADICFDFIERYNWAAEDSLHHLFARIGKSANIDESIAKKTNTEKRAYLSGMTSDIQEMKPFLLRNYRPGKSVITLSDDITICWRWGVVGCVGYVHFGETERDLMEGLIKEKHRFQMDLDYDGILSNAYLPWINTTMLQEDAAFSPLDINILIVSKIHEKLFLFYKQIDIDSILDRSNADALTDTHTSELTEEYVAATGRGNPD